MLNKGVDFSLLVKVGERQCGGDPGETMEISDHHNSRSASYLPANFKAIWTGILQGARVVMRGAEIDVEGSVVFVVVMKHLPRFRGCN